jgi:hypothetical protein
MSIDVSTAGYQFSHGHTPRGRGYWAFRIGDDPEPFWSKPQQTYSEAIGDARKLAVSLNASTIEVLP